MDIALARTLYIWSKGDLDKQAQLADWLDTAITAIATGNGASLASASANGVSATMMPGSLTVSAWASTISYAIALLENPSASTIRAKIV